jgi:hypothetical protein
LELCEFGQNQDYAGKSDLSSLDLTFMLIHKKSIDPINSMKTLTTAKLISLLLGMISFQSVTVISSAYALAGLPSGTYACWAITAGSYGFAPPIRGPFGDFILDGNGKYTNPSYKTSGRYRYQGSTVTFSGGEFDRYSAEIKETKNMVSLRFGRTPTGKYADQSCIYRKN